MSAPAEESNYLKLETLIKCFSRLLKDPKTKEAFVEGINLMTSAFSTPESRKILGENQDCIDEITRKLQRLSAEVVEMSGSTEDSSPELSLVEEKQENSQLMNEVLGLVQNCPELDQANLVECLVKVLDFGSRASQSEEKETFLDINKFISIAAKSLLKE